MAHGLGRIPQGVLRVLAPGTGGLVEVSAWTAKTVTFVQGAGASVDVPFTVWVY